MTGNSGIKDKTMMCKPQLHKTCTAMLKCSAYTENHGIIYKRIIQSLSRNKKKIKNKVENEYSNWVDNNKT